MSGRNFLLVICILAALVCGYDIFAAVRSGGQNIIAWVLAAIMAFIAISSLRKLLRNDYSNSWW